MNPNEKRVYSDLMTVSKSLKKNKYQKEEVTPIIQEQANEYRMFAEMVYGVSGKEYKRIIKRVIENY